MKNKANPEQIPSHTADVNAQADAAAAASPAQEAAAPAPAVPGAAMDANGLPMDQYHGKGGSFMLINGVRTPIDDAA